MFYTVYKTTNRINGKFYIGCHKTKDLDDKYLGSGKLLRRAIEKHGAENFTREILHVFDNPEEMFAKEAEIVTEEFLSENNCYNLKLGGEGGFDWINCNPDAIEQQRRSMLLKHGARYPMQVKEIADKSHSASKETMLLRYGIDNPARLLTSKKKISERMKLPENNNFRGKKHSVETKERIGSANSKQQQGSRNSQYGTCWINDGQVAKKVKKTDPIPEGWVYGRRRQ